MVSVKVRFLDSPPMIEEQETWKDIYGYDGSYEVSDLGIVRSVDRYVTHSNGREQYCKGCILKTTTDKFGYVRAYLSKQGKVKTICIHRLVLETFVGPCPDGMESAHDDGNPANNRLENLSWKTPKENQADRIRHGTDCRGEKQGASKLTMADVIQIRNDYLEGNNTQKEIGQLFGVAGSHISNIITKKTWTHI